MTDTDTTEAWHLDIDHAWYGELVIVPGETIDAEGEAWPLITWRMTPAAADNLVHALEALDEINGLLHARGGDGPDVHPALPAGLKTALEHLVEQGRLQALTPDRGWTWHELPAVTP